MVECLASLDRRSVAARGLLEWRAELIAVLGGEDVVTPQQEALVELVTRTRLYVDHLDPFLMAQAQFGRNVVSRKSISSNRTRSAPVPLGITPRAPT